MGTSAGNGHRFDLLERFPSESVFHVRMSLCVGCLTRYLKLRSKSVFFLGGDLSGKLKQGNEGAETGADFGSRERGAIFTNVFLFSPSER